MTNPLGRPSALLSQLSGAIRKPVNRSSLKATIKMASKGKRLMRAGERALLFLLAMIEPPQLRMIVESKFQRFQRVQDKFLYE